MKTEIQSIRPIKTQKLKALKTRKRILILVFLVVPLSLLLVFTYWPAIDMIRYSLFRWDGTSPNMIFVGIQNFRILFMNPRYIGVMINCIYYLVGSVVQLVIALIFAFMLSFRLKGTNFFKGVFFFPYLLNGVAVALMFLFFFEPNGTLNSILRLLGAEDQIRLWLTEPITNNVLLASISIWRYIGFNIVMFIAVINSIPTDIYEAAEVDGANRSQVLRLIVLPNIKMVFFLNLILAVKGAVSVFEVPFLVTGGDWGTSTFVIEALNITFGANPQYGLGSAFAVVLFVIIIIVTSIQKLLLKEE